MNTTPTKASGRTVAKGPDFDRLSGLRGLVPGERIVAKSAGLYRLPDPGSSTDFSSYRNELKSPGQASAVMEIPVGSIDKLTVRRSWFRSRLTSLRRWYKALDRRS